MFTQLVVAKLPTWDAYPHHLLCGLIVLPAELAVHVRAIVVIRDVAQPSELPQPRGGKAGVAVFGIALLEALRSGMSHSCSSELADAVPVPSRKLVIFCEPAAA